MTPPIPTDLKAEQRRIVIQAVLSALVCVAVLLGSYTYLPTVFAFPTDLAERLGFAMQVNVFVLLWVLLGVRLVARGRFRSLADIRGSAFGPPSPAIAVRVAFLQNTLEQAALAVGAYLALATLLSGPALSLIVGMALLFAIGRITFLRGYPQGAHGRAFGIVMTVLPTLFGYILAVGLIVANLLA